MSPRNHPHDVLFKAWAKALREGSLDLVLAQDVHGYWDLSALHKNAGVLSTLDWHGDVIVNGKLMHPNAPKGGMARRVKR